MFPDQGLTNKLLESFDADKADSLEVVVQYEITDAGNYFMTISNGCCQLEAGDHQAPTTTIVMDTDTLFNILEGKISGMQGFMFGKVKASGDQRLAAKLDSFFKKQNYR